MNFGIQNSFIKIGIIFLIGQIPLSSQQSLNDTDHCVLWNAALCMPTDQKDAIGVGTPDRGVDGNRNRVNTAGSCIHTHFGSDNWWMVDLVEEYVVHTIVITNRFAHPERVVPINIDLFLSDPRLDASFPKNTNGKRCAEETNVWYGTKSFDCPTPMYGRFVKIWKPTDSGSLNLCEVEVMVSQKRGDFHCQKTDSKYFSIAGNSTVDRVEIGFRTSTTTALACMHLCVKRSEYCYGFLWSKDTRDCRMLQYDYYNLGQITNEEGTDFYMESPIRCVGIGKWEYA